MSTRELPTSDRALVVGGIRIPVIPSVIVNPGVNGEPKPPDVHLEDHLASSIPGYVPQGVPVPREASQQR